MGRPTIVLRVNDTLVCSGVEPMFIPEGGAHVRAAVVRIPASFGDRPAVTATVRATSGSGAVGQVFGIYNIKVDELGPGDTQIAIEAANVSKEGVPIKGDFYCDYVVMGPSKPS